MPKDYDNKGLYESGELATKHINSYYSNNNMADLEELYAILISLGKRMLSRDMPDYQDVIDEKVHDLVSEMLLRIARKPEEYIHHENFFYYYRASLKRTFNDILKELTYARDGFVSIENPGEKIIDFTIHGVVPEASSSVLNRDSCKGLVKKVTRVLKQSMRFSDKADLLAWPVIYCILFEDVKLFDYLGFRDKVAIRIVIRLVFSNIQKELREFDA